MTLMEKGLRGLTTNGKKQWATCGDLPLFRNQAPGKTESQEANPFILKWPSS